MYAMALELKKESLCFADTLCKADTQKSVDFEINLPDYCTDIKKILKCFVTPGINSHSAVGDTVKISGNVTLRLVYINEKDKVDCFESSKDFISEIKLSTIPDDACITTRVKMNYVNCRVLSQRRMTVSTNLTVGACVSALSPCNVISDITDDTVEKKVRTQKTENVIVIKEKLFDLGETADLPEDMPAVEKIINVRGYATVSNTKAVSDKMLLKGQLTAEILYICDVTTGKTALFRHTMPISQIVDLPGADEKSICRCSVEIKQLTVSAKSAAKENRLIEVAAKVCAKVRCSELKEVTVIEDAYCKKGELKGQYAVTEFLCPVQSTARQITEKLSLSLGTDKLKEITDILPLEENCTFTREEGEAVFHLSAVLGILYTDSDGCGAYAEKNVDFDIRETLTEKSDSLICTPIVKIKEIDYHLAGKDTADLSLNIDITADIFRSDSLRILNSAEVTEKKSSHAAALTLYFAEEGEDLWEIAKRYSTSLDSIVKENGLKDRKKTVRRMLMIPSV